MGAFDLTADDLRAVLNQSPTGPIAGPSAAVASVFRSGASGTELLFIQRATKASDPWSGHMAFPGGRTDATDRDSHHTAQRETSEELGLQLDEVQRLGSLDDLQPGRHLQAVHAHSFWLEGNRPTLSLNYEVADALWVPLGVLADRERHIDHYYAATDSSWPGIQLDDPDQVVWGLTLRFLADLFKRLEVDFIELRPFP